MLTFKVESSTSLPALNAICLDCRVLSGIVYPGDCVVSETDTGPVSVKILSVALVTERAPFSGLVTLQVELPSGLSPDALVGLVFCGAA